MKIKDLQLSRFSCLVGLYLSISLTLKQLSIIEQIRAILRNRYPEFLLRSIESVSIQQSLSFDLECLVISSLYLDKTA